MHFSYISEKLHTYYRLQTESSESAFECTFLDRVLEKYGKKLESPDIYNFKFYAACFLWHRYNIPQ